MTPRVAYLNTQYPKISHTFIEREIQAVRAQGIEVRTFTIRPPGPSDLLSEAHRTESDRTTCLLDGHARLLARSLVVAATNPLGWLRGLLASQRLSPAGVVPRLMHLAYFLEATRLALELRRGRITHLHVHMANNGAAVALLACEVDRRLSYSMTIHGSAEFFDVHRLSLRAKASRAVFVRCISDFCRAQVMAWTSPEDWPRFHVIHCGLDLSRFHPAPRAESSGPLRLLTIGRLESVKGYPMLLEAIGQAREAGHEVTLEMVGDGPMRGVVERRIEELGLGRAVHLAGAIGQDSIQERIEAADALVVSSFMEGIPVVLMEAMAKGRPVISTSVGGVPELVEDGVSGILCRTGSPRELADAIARLAGARARFAEMGRAGRARIEREFDITDTGRRLAALLRRHAVASVAETRPASSQESPA